MEVLGLVTSEESSMNKLKILIMIIMPLISNAEEAGKWSHESEASVVRVDGNTKSESYSGKQKTQYKKQLDSYVGTARYVQTNNATTETGKSWDAALRYERDLSDLWAAFVQHGAESDRYAGYVQRDNTDLGGKYYFIKEKLQNLHAEAGVRYTNTIAVGAASAANNTSGRLYSEYTKKVNDNVDAKLWVEYLPNFKDSGAWLLNYEPSMSVMLSQVFSLKLSYLVKHHEKQASVNDKRDDSTFTTSLVAKF